MNPHTQKLMTMDDVSYHNQEIAKLLALLKESTRVFNATMRESGDRDYASQKSWEITGGYTKLWDKCCEEVILFPLWLHAQVVLIVTR